MAFDSTGFEPWPKSEPVPAPKPIPIRERALFVFIMVVAALLLIAPVSAEALVDLARYFGGK